MGSPNSNQNIILGLSMGHGDSSAAVIVNNLLVAAAEEERFNRKKHYALFPTKSLEYCLNAAKIAPNEVQIVAIGRKKYNAWQQKFRCLLLHPQLIRSKTKYEPTSDKKDLYWYLKNQRLTNAKVLFFEHHHAHMLSVRHISPEYEIALLSFDGLGDFVSTAIGKSEGDEIHIIKRVFFPHSIGFFYTAMTQYLGFPYFGDEFKVMGLSSYGKPRYIEQMRTLIKEKEPFGFTLNLHAFPILKEPIKYILKNGQPYITPFYDKKYLETLLGFKARAVGRPLERYHEDLAASIQMRFEEIANFLLLKLYEQVPLETVGLSGGCAHNSVWVGKIPKTTPFKKVVVAPASHDAGIAIGAAIGAAKRIVAPAEHWALLGPSLSTMNFKKVAEDIEETSFADDAKLINWILDALCRKEIVGLFRGRMEFGPRALGSRSILADPRDAEMRNRLNERVKHREPFRPFAASVLWEEQEKWFYDSFFCPFMEAVFIVKEDKREKIKCVVHVDNTCRIQSVIKETQPFYWDLINGFYRRTGIPMIVNTSFNDSEPIVCREIDAWNCFLNSDLDHLVIHNSVYSKKILQKALAI